MARHQSIAASAAFVRPQRLVAIFFTLCALALGAWQDAPDSVPATRQADTVFVISIEGEIDSVTSYSVARRLERAADAGADAVVFEIDSPGGELGAVLEISGEIKRSTIPTMVAWVNPEAISGGAIIALACQEIVISRAAKMGDAFPVTPTMDKGRMGLRGLTPDERTKLLPPLLADVVDSARRGGYDEYLVQAMVTDGIELWLVEHNQTGERFAINAAEYEAVFGTEPPRVSTITARIPGSRQEAGVPEDASAAPETDNRGSITDEGMIFHPAAPDLAPMTTAVTDRLNIGSTRPVFDRSQRGAWTDLGYITDGSGALTLEAGPLSAFGFASAVVTNDAELKAFFGAKHLVRLDQSWSESASRFLTGMGVRFVLIAVFLLALFIEMSSPGLVLPGTVAIGAAVLLIAPPMIIGMANWWEVGAILLGVLLIVLEIFVLPGFGVPGIIGLVALFAGLVGTFVPGQGVVPTDPNGISAALKGMVTIVLAFMTAGVGVYFVTKHFGSLPLLNRLILQDNRDESRPLSLAEIMGDGPAPVAGVGDEGVTTTPLKPVGQAEINDRITDVVSDLGFVEAGTPVRVVAVGSMRIVVEPIDAPHGGGSA